MKTTRIETFIGGKKESYTGYYYQNSNFNGTINRVIERYEDNGFEVSNVFKKVEDKFFYICVEFTKGDEK